MTDSTTAVRTITAAQWAEVAEDVAAGRVVVRDGLGDRVINIVMSEQYTDAWTVVNLPDDCEGMPDNTYTTYVGESMINKSFTVTPAATPQAVTAGDAVGAEAQTFAELCQREIVKIRDLVLYDDEYTGDLLGDAVGSPVGVTLCVEARIKQIVDLKAEIELLKTQIKKLKRTADLDDGFIDFLTTKDGE